jgi:hypothetical protein
MELFLCNINGAPPFTRKNGKEQLQSKSSPALPEMQGKEELR